MTEPIPCPSCGALLRLPPGQAMVRCPSCQTVLAVESVDEPAPAPPAPPASPVVPLPFGGPPRPAKPAPPPGPAARPVRGPVKRAKLAPDDPYDAAVEEDPDEKERERKRQIREELARFEEEEERERRRFDELKRLCAHARTGLRLCAVGSIGSSVVALFVTFFMMLAVIASPFVILVLFAGGLLVLHWLLTAAGQIFCLLGPREVRGTAAAGLGCTVGHALACAVTAVLIIPFINVQVLAMQADVTGTSISFNLLLTNIICNLTTLSDLPVYLSFGFPVTPPVMILVPVMAAALEFAKLSLLGLMTNRYAVLGKDPDLGYRGMRFVYRIFSLVLLGPVVKLTVAMMLAVGIIWVPLMLATIGYFLWWAFAWFAQYQVMVDTVDVLTAERLTDKRQRLDFV